MFVKLSSLSTKKKLLWVTLVALIIMSMAFIFSQSTLSTEEVSQESNAAGEIVEDILPPDNPVTDEVTNNMDKVGHFGEFFILGIFTAFFVGIFSVKKISAVCASLVFVELVALFDETLQIFTGRFADVIDMWFDVFGFAAASVIVYMFLLAVKCIKGIKER